MGLLSSAVGSSSREKGAFPKEASPETSQNGERLAGGGGTPFASPPNVYPPLLSLHPFKEQHLSGILTTLENVADQDNTLYVIAKYVNPLSVCFVSPI